MEVFAEYLAQIENPQQLARTEAVLNWVAEQFPQLGPRFAWNQPMFTDHGTFIIGFSVARQHLAVAPEVAALEHFAADIAQAGYDRSKGLFRIRWNQAVDFPLLARIISFNIKEKADCTTFWRK